MFLAKSAITGPTPSTLPNAPPTKSSNTSIAMPRSIAIQATRSSVAPRLEADSGAGFWFV